MITNTQKYIYCGIIGLIITFSIYAYAEAPSAAIYKCAVKSETKSSLIELSGLYTAGFERSMFVSENGNCTAWLTGDLAEIYSQVGGQIKGQELKAYITVRGKLSPSGMYGHFGVWEKEIRVTKVLRVTVIDEGQ